MKRLVLCFDGTWDKLDAPYRTKTYRVNRRKRTPAYARLDSAGDSLFMMRAWAPHRTNTFARGAYTARSFVGLVHTCGILQRSVASKVNEAIALYQKRDTSAQYDEEVLRFRRDNSPDVCITIHEQKWRTEADGHTVLKNTLFVTDHPASLGVLDTVGALGIPSRFFISKWLDKKLQFHDLSLYYLCRAHDTQSQLTNDARILCRRFGTTPMH